MGRVSEITTVKHQLCHFTASPEKMDYHKNLSFQVLKAAEGFTDGPLSGGIPANAPGS
jgi:hypothetical protein